MASCYAGEYQGREGEHFHDNFLVGNIITFPNTP